MRDIERLAEYISIPVPSAWEHCYEPAMAKYDPDWLSKLDFDAILDYYEYPKDFYYDRIHEELDLLAQDDTLNRICWLMHYILVYASNEDLLNIWTWGKTPFINHGSPTTCVVALLAGQACHARTIARCGYDQWQADYSRSAVRNVWIGQRARGVDGVGFNLMVWGAYYLRGYLVRLGRLNYEFGLKQKHEYADRFGEDAAYIYLHIPSAPNGLQDDEVAESLQMAREKLDVYFPECAGRKKVFAVRTWLLGPQLRQMLKPDSNIIKFQNRFEITDFYEGTSSYVSNIFKTNGPLESIDFASLPEETSLQKAIKERLLRGEKFQNGVGYIKD